MGTNIYQYISIFHVLWNVDKPILPNKMLTCCSSHNWRNVVAKNAPEIAGLAPYPLQLLHCDTE